MDENSLSESNVKVAIRVRPMNRREKDLKTKCVVEMEGNQTVLHPAVANVNKGDSRNQPKVFAYDYCFWSMDDSQTDKFAGQDVVFQSLGESLLDNAFMGYNACIFAYGQTGSGKSFTMMGSAEQPGLIPRLCRSLFSRTGLEAREGESFTVEVSFMEIYNEKVRDLLDPKGSRRALRVREHKVLGPYVENLSRLAVASYKDIECLMSEGNKSRTVAATNMNEESSRSHAVFNIILTHTLKDLQSGTSGEKVSKLSLVDLAGSERAAKSGAVGERLKEGSNINKSLSTLGSVIWALAEQGAGKNRSKFVPYRDSVLTWLLKDSLGGNSRTAMVATISPAADNYDETLSTLRYADRAKNIVNHAVVNEDPNARIIRELREEVEKLKEQLTEAESMKDTELKERLEESEKLIQEMTVTWEQKLRKTEAVAQERQKQLESLGISLQSSGIRVVDDKCFLVNLNADPALNELLVYYLKEHTLVGSANSQDIQLCGMAIHAQHCVIDITKNSGVVLTPHRNARTCVNGTTVTSPVQLSHGDRILWGNNHFFRISLPRHMVHAGKEEESAALMKTCLSSEQLEVEWDASSDVSSERSFGYEFAQAEVMMKGMGHKDPMQQVLQTLERQYEEEKRCALERQRQMYEQELQQLRQQLSPEKPSHFLEAADLPAASSSALPGAHKRMRRWSEDREAMMTRSLRRLREQIVRARSWAEEAGFFAEELNKRTEYLVTLQIPAANLDANRKRDVVLSEPSIQVRRIGKGKQVWSVEKMENRLVDMRELYQEWREWKESEEDNSVMRSYFKRADPFFDEQENHSLIGVANVFLACLFHDVKLQYAVPIINQKGEVAGRLHVEVWRGTESAEGGGAGDSEAGGARDSDDLLSSADADPPERRLDCVVKLLQATGLPRHLSNFVFCQYHFWGEEEPVFTPPEVAPSSPPSASTDPKCTVVFDSVKELSLAVSEDLLEFLAEGAVAIEVYGHKQANHRRNLALWDLGVIQAKTRSLRERWSEVTRRLELWVQLMELNEAGEFTAVEVVPARDVRTGGIFQLRQGQSHRVQVEVRSVPDSGTMPLITASILSVSIGDVKVQQLPPSKHSGDEEMDSYQEVDLERLREQWLVTLTHRQEYLDQQLQKIVSKPDKSEDDLERESQLLECRLTLTEERNAVLVPTAGSGIPGAPGERVPVAGMETHIPVLFLDLSVEDFQSHLSAPLAGGLDALLTGEDEDDFFDLRVVKHYDSETKVEASWDSTVHECPQLSRAASSDQRVYLTVRTVVQLSHPAHMQLVLRKRVCVNVTGRPGFAQSLLKKMSQRSTIPGCGVTFDIVSNIPGDIHGPEDREMLARLAASAEDEQSADSEAAIEKYLRSVLAVENILTLDRLRQEVALREQVAVRGRGSRRCLTSPNVTLGSASSLELFSPTHTLSDLKGWESHQDLFVAAPPSRRTLPSSVSLHLNPEAVNAPMPTMLKSLLPGGKEERRDQTAGHQQSLPRILVQSASVQEGLSRETNQIPIEEIIPVDIQTKSPRSITLPPPIIPEMEDSAPSPGSEASSGYLSSSMWTSTLSDVYTLSWDLPPSCSSAAEAPEAVHDERPRPQRSPALTATTQAHVSPPHLPAGQSEPGESSVDSDGKAVAEESEQPPSKPNVTLSSQQEPNPSPSFQVKAGELADPVGTQISGQAEKTTEGVQPQQNSAEMDNDLVAIKEHEAELTELLQTRHSDQESPLNQELEVVDIIELECEKSDHKERKAPVHEAQGDLESVIPPLLQLSQDTPSSDNTQEPAPFTVAPTSDPPGDAGFDGSKEPSPSKCSPNQDSTLIATSPAPGQITAEESSGEASPKKQSTSEKSLEVPNLIPALSPEMTEASDVQASSEQLSLSGCVSHPDSEPTGESDVSSKEQFPLEVSEPISASTLTSSSDTNAVQQEASSETSGTSQAASDPLLSNAQSSKCSSSLPNPFKIQKVRSSELRSFNEIVGEEEDKVSQARRLGSSCNLTVPTETLEIISDSEDGDPLASSAPPDWLKEGEFVTVGTNKCGTVRYLGPTEFAKGTWVGVELEAPAGKNDGSVGGKHYFHCNPGYGVLVRPHRVTRGGAKRRRQQQKRRSANLSGSSPNLAALTALAKSEGSTAPASRSRGENRKSWNP